MNYFTQDELYTLWTCVHNEKSKKMNECFDRYEDPRHNKEVQELYKLLTKIEEYKEK